MTIPETDLQVNHNAFRIHPARGVSLKTIKPQLKECGCHHQGAMSCWSCPIERKSEIEKLFDERKIKVTLKDWVDDHFDKSPFGKKADGVWDRIDILEQEHYKRDEQLRVRKYQLDDDIHKRNLSELDPSVLEIRQDLEKEKLALRELGDEIEQFRNSARLFEEDGEWPEPRPIVSELSSVQAFDPDRLLPPELREFVCDEADRMPCPTDFIASTLIVHLGAVIGSQCAIRPKANDSWAVIPNLWGAVVGSPSSKKSPSINAASQPLERLINKARDNHNRSEHDFKTEKIIFDAQEEAIEHKLKASAKKNNCDVERIARELSEHKQKVPQAPTLKRFKSNDTTVEKLGELLRDNSNGLLVTRDELVGLLASWDKHGREGERAFYLEGWNGGSGFDTDRIGRGSTYIPNLCVSLFGGIQPDKLTSYLDQAVNSFGNDGLLQRFQILVYPDERPWEWRDRVPNYKALEKVCEIFSVIGDDQFDPQVFGASPHKIPYFHFDDQAQKIFIEWCKSLHEKLRAEENPLIQQHLAKYEKLFPALSLIFHLVACVSRNERGLVKASSANMALSWCEHLETHARRCYSLVADNGLRAAIALSEKIKSSKLINGFTLRDIRRNQWKYLTTDSSIESALVWLEDEGWLKSLESGGSGPGSGRRTTRYLINPKISKKT